MGLLRSLLEYLRGEDGGSRKSREKLIQLVTKPVEVASPEDLGEQEYEDLECDGAMRSTMADTEI